MATITWTGTTSTDWNTASNWNTNSVPTSTDDVVIGTTAIPPTLGGVGAAVNSLTINGTDTFTLGDAGSGNSAGLDASAGGITIGGGGTITGQGSLSGNITVAGTATIAVSRVNAQPTPQLSISGTITDSGGNLTLGILDNDAELILTATSQANAVDFAGTTGQLRIFNTTLTMGGVMAIDTGEVFLVSGSTLTAASGITISTGTIFGDGTVAADVTATGAATIATNFGLLEVTGTITDSGNALTLSIAQEFDQLRLDDDSAANSVTFAANTTLHINTNASLTVATQMAIGNGLVQLSGGVASLTDASGVTISGGTIQGAGTVNAAITADSSASIIAIGFLHIFGAVTDSDDTLSLTINGDTNKLILHGASAANSLSFNSASGTLELDTTGTLLLSTNVDIGTGTVQLDGGSAELNAPTLSISTGTITGAGRVLGVTTATGAAQITASGGTLELVHQLTDSGGALALTIASGGDTLQLDFIASANTVNFNGGTLALTNQGTVTIASQMDVGSGLVTIDSSFKILNATNGITLNGGSIEGFGTVNANITGTGTVRALGGTLELQLAVSNSAGPTFQIADGASNVLDLNSTAGTGNTFAFLGTAGELSLSDDTGFDNTVSGLNIGTSTTTPTTFINIEGEVVTAIATQDTTTTGTITLSDGAVLHLTNLVSPTWFVNWISDGAGGTNVFLSTAACFRRGTLILTEAGEVPIEELAIDDRVMTLSGRARSIKWIGRRAYDPRFVRGNPNILPVRVMASALAAGVPARDLYLSPEHALYLDGLFLPARHLINGVTIRQDSWPGNIEYFHIELDTHNVIFADGAAAETFVAFGGRGMFHNGVEFAALYPDAEPPEWEPYEALLERGMAGLPKIRAGLLARAERLGLISHDPDLHLVVDGKIVRARSVDNGVYRFAVLAGANEVSIASRSVIPAETEVGSLDRRRLGVSVRRIVLYSAGRSIEIGPDCRALCEGFHADEETHRWTDGCGRLPADLLADFTDGVTVEVRLAAAELHYPAEQSASPSSADPGSKRNPAIGAPASGRRTGRRVAVR